MTSILAMIGEWTGKVRSTPTPKLTLRTVNVSRAPLPLRRITTPWNTCTRSRLPSTTRTCTFSVSPGAKSGMSSRRLARSTRSVAFNVRLLEGVGSEGRSPMLPVGRSLRELVEQPPLVGRQGPGPEEVGAAIEGPPQRQRPPPAGDQGVVARPQRFGHRPAAEVRRACVLRVLEQPGPERLVVAGLRVAHHARNEAGDGLDHDERGSLSAGEHVV